MLVNTTDFYKDKKQSNSEDKNQIANLFYCY